MRGKNKLHKLNEDILVVTATVTDTNTATLYDQKVKCIVTRYYHFITNGHNGTKLKLDEVLQLLSQEFFLSTERISNIITANEPMLRELRQAKPKPSLFKIKWAHLIW